jgi:hypothetical protein
MEFACATGDEDTTGTCIHAVGDVPGQRVEVDGAARGERRDREEQNSGKNGACGT